MTTSEVSVPTRDANSDPLWVQAAAIIEAQVADGTLAPGAKLAAERDLCTTMAVSRVTLRKALGHLVDRGILQPSHGRGWFVAQPASAREWPNELESFTATARRKHMTPGAIVTENAVRAASLDESERLDVAAGTPLLHLERIRTLDGVRIAVDRNVIPLALAPGLSKVDLADRSLFDELRRYGIVLQRAETTIEARAADEVLAAHLDLEVGAPVLVLDETLFGDSPRPLLWSTVRYSGERYRLRTTFRTR
ncbi:transcriptional regulator [Actinomycetota bacterium]|nr:transcriptional regulator [Actinomycetota bacterium]